MSGWVSLVCTAPCGVCSCYCYCYYYYYYYYYYYVIKCSDNSKQHYI